MGKGEFWAPYGAPPSHERNVFREARVIARCVHRVFNRVLKSYHRLKDTPPLHFARRQRAPDHSAPRYDRWPPPVASAVPPAGRQCPPRAVQLCITTLYRHFPTSGAADFSITLFSLSHSTPRHLRLFISVSERGQTLHERAAFVLFAEAQTLCFLSVEPTSGGSPPSAGWRARRGRQAAAPEEQAAPPAAAASASDAARATSPRAPTPPLLAPSATALLEPAEPAAAARRAPMSTGCEPRRQAAVSLRRPPGRSSGSSSSCRPRRQQGAAAAPAHCCCCHRLRGGCVVRAAPAWGLQPGSAADPPPPAPSSCTARAFASQQLGAGGAAQGKQSPPSPLDPAATLLTRGPALHAREPDIVATTRTRLS